MAIPTALLERESWKTAWAKEHRASLELAAAEFSAGAALSVPAPAAYPALYMATSATAGAWMGQQGPQGPPGPAGPQGPAGGGGSTPPPPPPPPPPPTGTVPNAPSSLGAPTNVIFDDEFNTGSLNTSLWAPSWFGNGNTQNGTVMEASNVSLDANGIELAIASNRTGGIISTNPDDGVSGHTGFACQATSSKPVYVEYKGVLPLAANGTIANWPGFWITGQSWPMTGEIDLVEGFGNAQWHAIWGSSSSGSNFHNPGGVGALASPLSGSHTFGVLWTPTNCTFVYDGVIVGSQASACTGPMYLVAENSLGPANLIPATVSLRYVRVWQ